MRKNWIVNRKTNEYCEVAEHPNLWDGEWKERYPHCAGASWLDVMSYKIYPEDNVNGIPYLCDNCCDGGMFGLLVDINRFSPEDIDKAKESLRTTNDVVSIRVYRFKKVQAPAKPYADQPPTGGRWPMAGDAVRLTGEFMGVRPGSIGIIGGSIGKRFNDLQITFNHLTFRDDRYVECSGGPGTISTQVLDLLPTDEIVTVRCWKWRDVFAGAGCGEGYEIDVPVWEWKGER